MTGAADRHFIFGMLALQSGLVDQGPLAAFQAGTRDKARSLADQLVARGDLDADAGAGLEPPLSHPSLWGEVVLLDLLTRCRARVQIVVLEWIPPGP